MSSPIEELVDTIKARLALGPEAGPLLQGLLRTIFGEPGGLKGFLDKLSASGLGAQASSWIGKTDNPPLSPQGALQAFGAETVAKIANKVGVDPGIAAAALAYATPKIVGLLTAGGAIPTVAPAAVAAFLGSSPAGSAAATRPVPKVEDPAGRKEEAAGLRRWILPAIVILLALAFLAHFWGEKHEETATPAPAATTPH
ncbi:MAG: YidB family protein [Methylocella sp.]